MGDLKFKSSCGKKVWFAQRKSWGSRVFSADGGKTWHKDTVSVRKVADAAIASGLAQFVKE